MKINAVFPTPLEPPPPDLVHGLFFVFNEPQRMFQEQPQENQARNNSG